MQPIINLTLVPFLFLFSETLYIQTESSVPTNSAVEKKNQHSVGQTIAKIIANNRKIIAKTSIVVYLTSRRSQDSALTFQASPIAITVETGAEHTGPDLPNVPRVARVPAHTFAQPPLPHPEEGRRQATYFCCWAASRGEQRNVWGGRTDGRTRRPGPALFRRSQHAHACLCRLRQTHFPSR